MATPSDGAVQWCHICGSGSAEVAGRAIAKAGVDLYRWRVEFLCLGPLEVRADGLPVDLGEPQRRLVVALLLAHSNEVVSTDQLTDGIWGDSPPASARKIVQGYVAGLRKALGDTDTIESVRPGYRLNVKDQAVDARRFEELGAQGASEISRDPDGARLVLRDALALWRGTPYQDLSDFDVLRPEIVRLQQLRLTAVENQMEAEIFAGNESSVVDDLGDLCHRHPLRERLWTLRMLALSRSGRATEALRAYDVARQYLAEEVGLEPSPDLQLMQERVLQQSPILETTSALAMEEALPPLALNPYKGLRAFDEDDAADFFGRDALVRRLREILDQRDRYRLVVLTGPSGSGKSSVVRAGLIPEIRNAGWNITTMYPGNDPVGNLASVTAIAADPPSGPQIVVVDQLEEVFTLVDDRAVQTAFLDAVVEAVDPNRGGPWVLATIRADFLDKLMRHRGLADLLSQSLVIVTPLDDHELSDVVQRPASRVGTAVEPGLVAAIVRDAGDRPSALPLLQFALTDLFDRADGQLLTLDSYRLAGGIAGALVARVETLYREFDDEKQDATRQLVLRLVAIDEGSDPTKRRIPLSSIDRLPHIDSVLERLVEHRLLTLDRTPAGEPTVEVAHEALLSEWPRVRSWIDDAKAGLLAHARLSEGAAEWEASERSDDFLLTGARLARLAAWDETVLSLTDAERQFLDASVRRETEVDAQRRRRRRAVLIGFASAAVVAAILATIAVLSANLANEREQEARAESLAATAVSLLDDDPELSMLLGIEALELSPNSTAAASALDSAVQVHRTIFTVDRSSTSPAVGSISPNGELLVVVSGRETLEVFTVGNETPLWRRDAEAGTSFDGAAFTNDGQVLVSEFGLNEDQPTFSPMTWVLYEPLSGDIVHRIDVGEPCTVDRWSMGGANTSTGFVDVDHPLFLARYGVLPDGRCEEVQTVRAELVGFDLWTGSITTVADTYLPSPVGVATVSADGERIAFASGGPGAVIDVSTGETILRLTPGVSTISADGTRVLTGDDALRLIDVDSGDVVNVFPGDYARALFGASGRLVLASSFDGSTRVMDARDGRVLYELRGAGGRDLSIQANLDETLVVTFARDGTARVWDIGNQMMGTVSTAGYAPTDPDAYLLAAELIASPPLAIAPIGLDGSAETAETALFELDTWERVRTLPGLALAVSPDGSKLVMQSWPGPVDRTDINGSVQSYNQVAGLVVVDVASGATIREFNDGPCLWYTRIDNELFGPDCGDYPEPWVEGAVSGSFSPDGSLFAMGGSSGYAAVWDVASGDLVRFFDSVPGGNQFGNRPYSVQVAFSPAGGHLAVLQWVLGTLPVLHRVDTVTWDADAVLDFPEDEVPTAMVYTPDGRTLVAGDRAGDILIIDAETWEVETRLEGQQGGQIHDLAVSPDGRLVAAGGIDGALWVWDIELESVVRRIELRTTVPPPGISGVINVEFVDQQTLLGSSEVSAVLLTLDPDVLLSAARSRATRTFTTQECATYHIDPCP